MDNSEFVEEDIERGSITSLPLLSRSQTHERDEPTSDHTTPPLPLFPTDVPSWSKPLTDALEKNDWVGAKVILESVPEAINGPVGRFKGSPLVYAIQNNIDMRIIENLINMTTPPEKLAYSNEGTKATALHFAVIEGNYSAAKLLISKYPPMLKSIDWRMRTPIHTALMLDRTEMAFYMLKVCLSHIQDTREVFDETRFSKDLELAIKKRRYDFAYILIQQFPNLALQFSPWKMLTEECIDLPCRSRLNMLQSIIYHCIQIDEKIISKSFTHSWEDANTRFMSTDSEIQPPNNGYSRGIRALWKKIIIPAWELIASPIKSVGRVKLRHHQVIGIVRGLCEKMIEFNEQDRLNTLQRVFWSAIENGTYDIVEVILQMFPVAIRYENEEGNNALQFAASHRDAKIFHLVHKLHKRLMHDANYVVDHDGNTILHLVAKKARRNNLGSGSGQVLQLQHEIQWYKAMEKILPGDLKFKKNSDKKVPFEVFDEEHRDMLKSESDWITIMANSCMVAGSLIAALVFAAAAITFPAAITFRGDGFPNFAKDGAFTAFVFAISDAVALVFSLIAVVTFLSIFTTRYSIANFQYNLPNKLVIGLISLLVSVTSMMIAFSAIIYLLSAKDYNMIIYPTIVVSLVSSFFFFAYLQLPSLLKIIKSTYGSDIFKDDNVRIISEKREPKYFM